MPLPAPIARSWAVLANDPMAGGETPPRRSSCRPKAERLRRTSTTPTGAHDDWTVGIGYAVRGWRSSVRSRAAARYRPAGRHGRREPLDDHQRPRHHGRFGHDDQARRERHRRIPRLQFPGILFGRARHERHATIRSVRRATAPAAVTFPRCRPASGRWKPAAFRGSTASSIATSSTSPRCSRTRLATA